jgi:hypothetical protein
MTIPPIRPARDGAASVGREQPAFRAEKKDNAGLNLSNPNRPLTPHEVNTFRAMVAWLARNYSSAPRNFVLPNELDPPHTVRKFMADYPALKRFLSGHRPHQATQASTLP